MVDMSKDTYRVDVEHNGLSMPCVVKVNARTSRVWAWDGMGSEITFKSHPKQYLKALQAALRAMPRG